MNQNESIDIEGPDFGANKLLHVGGWSLLYKIVCAPGSWDADKVALEATIINPPGTSLNEWVVTDVTDEHFRHSEHFPTNPIQCKECKDRKHWILNC